MNINEIKLLCGKCGFNPSKRYGQNYLVNDGIVKKIIEAGDLKSTDTVVEIGPGFGVLTFALAERVKKVIAFEIERKLEGYWSDLEIRDKEIRDRVEIKWGNALFGLKTYDIGHRTYKVVANLPYQITSDVLRTLLELENKPDMIVIMVQKEVAERICARPQRSGLHGGQARRGGMSLLSVAVQYFGEPKIIAKVPAGSFWPRPKVESAIVCIKTQKHLNTKTLDDKEFFRVVRAGFAQKRKMLWSNLARGLKLDGGKVKEILREVVGNEKVRAEEVGMEEWRAIVSKCVSK